MCKQRCVSDQRADELGACEGGGEGSSRRALTLPSVDPAFPPRLCCQWGLTRGSPANAVRMSISLATRSPSSLAGTRPATTLPACSGGCGGVGGAAAGAAAGGVEGAGLGGGRGGAPPPPEELPG